MCHPEATYFDKQMGHLDNPVQLWKRVRSTTDDNIQKVLTMINNKTSRIGKPRRTAELSEIPYIGTDQRKLI